jgi:hypothetical protein
LSYVAVVDRAEVESCKTIRGQGLRNNREALLLGVDSVQCRQAEEK